MEKKRVIFVVLNEKFLRNALTILNFSKARPFIILMDSNSKSVTVNEKIKIQIIPLALLNQVIKLDRNYLWLICGRGSSKDAPAKLKSFLAANGVPEDNIINGNSFIPRRFYLVEI